MNCTTVWKEPRQQDGKMEIVDYAYAHFSQYQNYTVTDSTADRAIENAEKYKEEMSRLQVWGSHAEILAASALN